VNGYCYRSIHLGSATWGLFPRWCGGYGGSLQVQAGYGPHHMTCLWLVVANRFAAGEKGARSRHGPESPGPPGGMVPCRLRNVVTTAQASKAGAAYNNASETPPGSGVVCTRRARGWWWPARRGVRRRLVVVVA
jgi:hypothetical protein